jgi:hypothetical protein
MPEPTDDDIRALRHQGDLRAYLRNLARPTRHPTPEPANTTTYSPTHHTGAWPHPTRPPTSPICQPDCPCAIHPPNPHTHPNASAPA